MGNATDPNNGPIALPVPGALNLGPTRARVKPIRRVGWRTVPDDDTRPRPGRVTPAVLVSRSVFGWSAGSASARVAPGPGKRIHQARNSGWILDGAPVRVGNSRGPSTSRGNALGTERSIRGMVDVVSLDPLLNAHLQTAHVPGRRNAAVDPARWGPRSSGWLLVHSHRAGRPIRPVASAHAHSFDVAG